MKTKYLFGAAAALMMAACSQDELVSVKQDGIRLQRDRVKADPRCGLLL